MLKSNIAEPIVLNGAIFNNDEFIINLKKNWKNNDKMVSKVPELKLLNAPFKICILQNFLQPSSFVVHELVNEMVSMEWYRKEMDLYRFYQTADCSIITRPYLRDFYRNLQVNVLPWMEKVCNIELTDVSASCSLYNNGDHLLVHDDLLKDRRIAFVYYLSPWPEMNEWTSDMGGALELFSCNADAAPIFPVVEKIFPKNNQFVFFDVSSKSFHQVGEVTTSVFPRLTINGWFHGPRNELPSTNKFDDKISPPNNTNFNLKIQYPHRENIDLTNWIEAEYLRSSTKKKIQKQIEENSQGSFGEFLVPLMYEQLENTLKSDNESMKWILQGPANKKNFETLCIDSSQGCIKDLIHLFTSNTMFKLLHEYTELDLFGPKSVQPSCTIDIVRITQGSYSILSDALNYTEDALDVIIFFNVKENIGNIAYVNPDEEINDDDDNDNNAAADAALLSVLPLTNSLNLVYRTFGTTKFFKYCSKNFISKNEFTYILIASFKE